MNITNVKVVDLSDLIADDNDAGELAMEEFWSCAPVDTSESNRYLVTVDQFHTLLNHCSFEEYDEVDEVDEDSEDDQKVAQSYAFLVNRIDSLDRDVYIDLAN